VSEGSPPSERYDSPDDAAAVARRAEARIESPRQFDTSESGSDIRFPWPPADGASVVGAFVQTWQGATFQPTSFFRALPERASVGAAVLYYLPLGIIIAGAELFWSLVLAPAAPRDNMLPSPLVQFLLSPLLLLVSLFLSSLVTHALLAMFGAASRDYSTTTRVFAFAYSPMIFTVVPVLGTIVGFVWMVVCAIIGVREAHRTSTGRAAAAILIPVAFALIVLGLFYLARAAGNLLEMPV
jgi:hypothetical protein